MTIKSPVKVLLHGHPLIEKSDNMDILVSSLDFIINSKKSVNDSASDPLPICSPVWYAFEWFCLGDQLLYLKQNHVVFKKKLLIKKTYTVVPRSRLE